MLLCRCRCVTSHAACAWHARWATKRKSQFCKFYSRVSKVTLSLFGFPGLRLGTKLGCVLPLRMRHKAMQLLLGRPPGHKLKSHVYSVSEVMLGPFWCSFARFGHEIGCSFGRCGCVTNHAACAWQARWRQN